MRNFVIDTTAIAPGTAATGIHWPTSQATSLINIQFNMPTAANVVHVGLFVESGELLILAMNFINADFPQAPVAS